MGGPRWYSPVGVTPTQAELDLVDALHDQGYTFTKDTSADVWTASCKFDIKYCELDIGLDPKDERVEVTFYPGS